MPKIRRFKLVKSFFRFSCLAFLLSFTTLGRAQAIYPDLLYYPFLENSSHAASTNVPFATDDQSGNGTTGWVGGNGPLRWVPNQMGVNDAIHFDGTSSFIAATNNASLYSFTTNHFTVGLVMRPDNNDWLPLLGNVNSNNPSEYGWYVAEWNGGYEIHFENNGAETVARQGDFPAYGWGCSTIAACGTNVSINCNGLSAPVNYYLYNSTAMNNPAASLSPVQFGELASGVEDLDGDLSAIAIWSHALSFYEQQEWYNANMPNLIEEWKLWGNANDSSLYTNASAALVGNPFYTTGPDGVDSHALYLNGTSQYLCASNYATYPVTSFGISFWIKPDSINSAEDLFQWADDGAHNYSIQTGIMGSSGTLYCRLWAGPQTWFDISSLGVQPNIWNHVEISWFGWQTNNCYPIFRINGILDTNQTISGSGIYGGQPPPNNFPAIVSPISSVPLNFGLRSDNVTGIPFAGAVSDIQLYINGQSDYESSLIYNSMVNSNYEGHIGPPGAGSLEILPPQDAAVVTNAPVLPDPGVANTSILPDLLYYPFLENIGNTNPTNSPLLTADYSGNGTTGWFYEVDGANWVPNEIGVSNALHFHGLDSYIVATNNASLYSFTTNDFSVGLLIHPYGSAWLPLLGNVNSNNPSQYGWYVAEGNGDFEIHLENNGSETVARQANQSANGWSCVTLSRTGTNVSIVCNGFATAINYNLYNTSTFNDPAPSPSPLQFCENASGVPDLDGDLSAVGIWGHALSFYESQEWYNANMPNLVQEWKLWGNPNDTSFYTNSPVSYIGNPTYTTGPDGVTNHALYLNDSQYVSQSNYSTIPISAFGLSFWIKPDSITGSEDLFQWADDGNHNYSIQTGILGASGVLYCRLWSGNNTWYGISSLPVRPHSWNHVQISWFGWQTNNCYPIFRINGALDTNEIQSTGTQVPINVTPAYVNSINSVPFNFGLRSDNSANGGNPYQGAVSDVQLYINGLSDNESSLIYRGMVNSNYTAHVGPPFDGSIQILPQVNPQQAP